MTEIMTNIWEIIGSSIGLLENFGLLERSPTLGKNKGFPGFWKVKVKSFESNVKQNNSTELLALPKIEI